MVPSLVDMCGVPVVVVISNHPDVKKQIFSSSTIKLYQNYDEQKRWENDINEQTSKILKDYNSVLKSIFPRLRVKFIGIEMLKWAEKLQLSFDLPLKFTQDFIKSSLFTSKGIIDEDKAARELVNEQSFNLLLKYKIACHFFLEDIVPNLWQELQNNEPNFKGILSELSFESPMAMWSKNLNERSSNVQNYHSAIGGFKVIIFFYGVRNKNIAAIKFSLDPKWDPEGAKIIERKCKHFIIDSFTKCVIHLKDNFPTKLSLDSSLSKEIVTGYNFIEYFISTINEKELLLKSDRLACRALVYFLYWPYQYQFMKIAQIAFEIMYEPEYHSLLCEITSFIHEENLNSSYNYRLLLREFWIKSPTLLKESVIEEEAGELILPNQTLHNYLFLIEKLFRIKQFTSDDMQNVYLIVKDASPADKEKIFQIQGKNVCGHLCSLGNYKIADYFFKVLDLDEDTVKAFKKEFAFDFFLCIVKKKSSECVSDEFFKWVLGTEEIDGLKDEIFYTLTHTNKIENLFEHFPGESGSSFVDKILRFFLKTDDNIEDWKKKYFIQRGHSILAPHSI